MSETTSGAAVDHGASQTAAPSPAISLQALIGQGLTFSDCVRAFGVDRDTNPHARYAFKKLTVAGEIEVDDSAVLSEADDGCYVMAWLWVSNEDAAAKLDN